MKITLSGITLTLLLIGMLTLAFDLQPVKAEAALVESPWPMFQHDAQHTGRSPFVGPSKNAKAGILLGNKTIDDIFGSPVIGSDGTLYLIESGWGLCAHHPDGAQKWSATINAGFNPPALFEPAKIVYAHSNQEIFAVNMENGSLRWNRSFTYVHSYLVVAENGVLYLTALRQLPDDSYRNYLIGLDEHGEEVLSYDIGEMGPEPSCPTIDKEGTIYFGYNATLFAINANGTERWRRTFEADIKYHTPSPPIVTTPSIADDGTIYVVVFGQSDWRTGTDQGWHNHLHAVDPENPSIDKWEHGYVYSYGFTRPGVPPAIDFEGNVYVTKSYYVPGSGSHKVVLVYAPEGELKISMDLAGGFLLIDVQNTVYSLGLLTPSAASLRIFDSEGNETIVTLPYQEGSRQPFLSLASDGTLYVGGHKNLYAIPLRQHIPEYCLTIHSTPVGVTFTVDSVPLATPWSGIYSENTSVSLVMPETHDGYVWSHWFEDGYTDRIKTVAMDRNITLTGIFVFAVQPHGPEAEFEATPDTALKGESIKFDASASLPGWNGTHEMLITEYRWDLGDSNETTTSVPIIYHSFSSPGNYYVTLTVYAPGATPETDSTTHKVTITAIPVGGYSIPIEGYTTEKPPTLYFALIAILAASFTMIRRKTQKRTKRP